MYELLKSVESQICSTPEQLFVEHMSSVVKSSYIWHKRLMSNLKSSVKQGINKNFRSGEHEYAVYTNLRKNTEVAHV